MITRRRFAQGLALAAAGLLVPEVAVEATRRLWALDGTMLTPADPPWDPALRLWAFRADHGDNITAYSLLDAPPLDTAVIDRYAQQICADTLRDFARITQRVADNYGLTPFDVAHNHTIDEIAAFNRVVGRVGPYPRRDQ
jgi:hypothetical protein